MNQTYKLSDRTLTFNQFFAFLEGRAGQSIAWEQVRDMTPEDIRQAEAMCCRPYLFGKRVHVLSDPQEYQQ